MNNINIKIQILELKDQLMGKDIGWNSDEANEAILNEVKEALYMDFTVTVGFVLTLKDQLMGKDIGWNSDEANEAILNEIKIILK